MFQPAKPAAQPGSVPARPDEVQSFFFQLPLIPYENLLVLQVTFVQVRHSTEVESEFFFGRSRTQKRLAGQPEQQCDLGIVSNKFVVVVGEEQKSEIVRDLFCNVLSRVRMSAERRADLMVDLKGVIETILQVFRDRFDLQQQFQELP